MDWAWAGVVVLAFLAAGFAAFVVFGLACLIVDLVNEWRNS